ncbi:hypothetical protein HK100_012190, partial [Physocladia obscura]
MPVIHFRLLKTNFSSSLVVSLSLAMMIIPPMLFPCENYHVDQISKLFAWLVFVLRTFEIATFDRRLVRKWSLFDYFELLATSSNDPMRIERQPQSNKTGKLEKNWHPLVVNPQDRTPLFFLRVAAHLFLTLVAYALSRAYLAKHPYYENFG